MTLNEVKEKYANISIQSSTMNFILGIGQSAKLNLTSPDYYDIYIKLETIVNNKAKLTIQLINEPIEKPAPITGKIIENETKSGEKTEISKNLNLLSIELKKMKMIVYGLITGIIMIICILIYLKRKKIKEEVKKEYREKFRRHVKPDKK